MNIEDLRFYCKKYTKKHPKLEEKINNEYWMAYYSVLSGGHEGSKCDTAFDNIIKLIS
jgi:hypothetical protein